MASQYLEKANIPENLIPSDPRFGCGPSVIPMEYLDRLKEYGPHFLGTSHRKPAVKNLGKDIQAGLLKYFGLSDDYLVVFGNGGATQFFDICGLNLVKNKSVHYVCGEFSSKWHKSHNMIPGITAEKVAVDFGKGINPKNHADADMVCCTLNETSTGVILSDLPEMDDDTLLCMDATSGGGQVDCDLKKVDVFFFGPQKVFGSEGGLFIAIMSPKALKRAAELKDRPDFYRPQMMDLQTLIDNSEKHQVFNTPSISTMFFLNEQIKEMNKVGYAGVIKEGQRKAKHLYDWAESKDYLRPFIEAPEFRSTVVATIDVDDRINADDLVKELEAKKWVYDINAYRKLGRNQFRISMFHNVKFDDLQKLTELLSTVIEANLA